jgi:dolichyldiphosphatase
MYFATYALLASLYLPLHPSLPKSSILAPLAISPWATSIALSRVWLGRHTWPQVAVGCSYGVVFAGIWFGIWLDGIDEYGKIVEGAVDEYFSSRKNGS